MSMDTASQILDTIRMIEEDRLDVRTVTMGVSLLGCADRDVNRAAERLEDHIRAEAGRLVATADEVGAELGVPIINKRVAVTPISLVAAACGDADPLPLARALDRVGKDIGVDFIGGYSALVDKGATAADERLMRSIPQALATTDLVCASVNVGSTRAGLNMDAVALMGEVVTQAAQATADAGGLGAAKLVTFANAVGDNPFMAGAFHGVGEPDTVISVGVSGPGVVARALARLGDARVDECAEAIKKAAFHITRMGQLVGREVARRLDKRFGIVDLSLAPTADVGDSVAHILELMGIEQVGGHGTTAALALLNDAVKKGGLMACSHVGGLSGSFIPVSEDRAMIEAAAAGTISLDKLEAMTAICSVGLDMVALPGDTPASTIAAIIADESAIGIMNSKTTAVRVIPVPGKRIGDEVHFPALLGWAPIMATSPVDSSALIARGGRMPAPIHAFKN